MHDHLVSRPRRQQLTTMPLMTRLPALFVTRAPLRLRWLLRSILARRLRRVPRVPSKPPLQLRDPLILPSDPHGQRLDPRVHPQQNLDHDLTTLVIDRLSLNPLHTTRFDSAQLCPPDQLNAYAKRSWCRSSSSRCSSFSPERSANDETLPAPCVLIVDELISIPSVRVVSATGRWSNGEDHARRLVARVEDVVERVVDLLEWAGLVEHAGTT
jgi:hypothetical protein